MPGLECRRISKVFGGHTALRDVSLAFPTCGIMGIIGPNGAGKTTLLNIFSGFSRPDFGEVLLNGRDLATLPPYRRARLGIFRTFQQLRLIRRLTLTEHIMLAMDPVRRVSLYAALRERARRLDEQQTLRCREILALVGLTEKHDEYVGSLSYGQQKILSIAIGMAARPQILILDEPVSGVSPRMGAEIVALLRRMVTEHRLIVFVEHDLEMVREVADSVVVMDHGEVIAQGPPSEVLDRRDVLEAYVD